MGWIIGLLITLLLIYVLHWLSRFCFRAASYLEEEKLRKQYHDQCIRESLFNISASVAKEPEQHESVRDKLLEANREIIKKKQLDDAIRDELNINF